MDAVLVTLTGISLVSTLLLAALAWTTTRRERERSAARVAALAAAIDDLEPRNETPPLVCEPPGPVEAPGGSMFSGRRSITFEGHTAIKAAVGLGMVLALVAAGMMSGSDPSPAEQPAPRKPSGSAAAPIELISMRHTRDGETFTVAGLVRNPRGGAEIRRVTAIVLGFDRRGGLLTSGRGPLDFITLQPGDESAFVVTLSRGSSIARYRVAFQTEGGVVRHIDRRADRPALSGAKRNGVAAASNL